MFVLLEITAHRTRVVATFADSELANLYARLHRVSGWHIVEVPHYTDED